MKISEKEELRKLFKELLDITRDTNCVVELYCRGNLLCNTAYISFGHGRIMMTVHVHVNGTSTLRGGFPSVEVNVEQVIKLIRFLAFIPAMFSYNKKRWEVVFHEQGHPEYIRATTKLKEGIEKFINEIKREVLQTI
jgi:hypothetical protein